MACGRSGSPRSATRSKRGGGGDGDAKAVAGGVCVGLGGGGEEPFEVLGGLDDLPGVVAAPMASSVCPSKMRTQVAPATSVSGFRTWVWGIE